MPGGNNGALRPYGRRAMPVIHAAEGHTGLGTVRRGQATRPAWSPVL